MFQTSSIWKKGVCPFFWVLVVIGLIVLLAIAVAAMPALLAEVFLDVFIVSVFYRRLRLAAQEHWLGTALRKTWWLALVTAALFFSGWLGFGNRGTRMPLDWPGHRKIIARMKNLEHLCCREA